MFKPLVYYLTSHISRFTFSITNDIYIPTSMRLKVKSVFKINKNRIDSQ